MKLGLKILVKIGKTHKKQFSILIYKHDVDLGQQYKGLNGMLQHMLGRERAGIFLQHILC